VAAGQKKIALLQKTLKSPWKIELLWLSCVVVGNLASLLKNWIKRGFPENIKQG
jgi:hypothetical protein